MTNGLKRVLFVCIGNSCRSQMAEAFARKYGADVLIPASAGVAPASIIAPDTIRAMKEKGVEMRDAFPKAIRHLGRAQFELVVNMSGVLLPPETGARIVDWDIPDPINVPYEKHCDVRDEIERRVMRLILDLRRETTEPKFRGQGSGTFQP
jgi:arsenate reductase